MAIIDVASKPAIDQRLLFKTRLKRFLFEVPFVLVANAVIGALLTVTKVTPNDFFENQVFCFFVGSFSSILLHLMIWRLLANQIKLTPWVVFAVTVVGCVFGLLLGISVGSILLGIKIFGSLLNMLEMSHVYLLLILLMCTATLIIFWIRSKMEKLRADIAQEKLRAETNARRSVQAQLQLLQAQIEPHMLFNTLANVQGLISFDPPRASEMLDQLILYLRASLQVARSAQTTLGAEFALMQAYLELMAVRMGARLTYELHLSQELASLPIAPMLLQPLIENAIKHGVEPKVEGGKIVVTAQLSEGSLLITCADTGLGLDAPAQPGTRVGLANVRERLQALYGEQAQFQLYANVPEGAIAEIRLPLP